MAAAVLLPVSTIVVDLTVRRLERALRARARYRYVRPLVVREGKGFRIQSPCCSRKIDPTGGVIDIALLVPQDGGHWALYSRDHAHSTWESRHQDASLEVLLDLLCIDSARQFWA
jgi:hypothetical protein